MMPKIDQIFDPPNDSVNWFGVIFNGYTVSLTPDAHQQTTTDTKRQGMLPLVPQAEYFQHVISLRREGMVQQIPKAMRSSDQTFCANAHPVHAFIVNKAVI